MTSEGQPWPEAGQGQVAGDSLASVLIGDDVIDLEGSRTDIFGQVAVFAPSARAAANESAKTLSHRSDHAS